MKPNMTNAEAFMKYLIEEADFDLDNYNRVLELNSEVRKSLSIHIDNSKQYLISPCISFSDLLKYDICGEKGEIMLDKNNMPYISSNRKHGNYDFFDVIVSKSYCKNLYAACHFDKDIYIGFCKSYTMTGYSKIEELLDCYVKLCNYLNKLGKDYELINDVDTYNDKVFCLVKKRKK